ncbi:uncharacterized protein SCHCODRAFT_02541058 [Schizophyllum commune H4-8]|nr:uncharacterized protein SCHCODRAFT_02541058 [Schizophyllum commune H4-8]KAI5894446.1 hypothetical protein SCHCODRAFT_02541058 [Schizophyllum commune H4-8]
MNDKSFYSEREQRRASSNSGSDPNSAGLFARIRSINGLALNTLASFFAKTSPYSPRHDEYFDNFGPGDQQHSLSTNRRLSSLFEPRNSRSGKGFVHGPAKGPLGSPAQITSSQAPAQHDTASSGSDLDLTPPLTPDIANNESHSFDSLCSFAHSGLGEFRDDTPPPLHSPEVREGKKPERRIYEEPPGDDFSGTLDFSAAASTPAVADDSEEWVGLEYSIELSTRERHISDALSHASAGEHSKSRESWAALHAGTMHPIVEEEEYSRWVNWHRYLDQQEERRRHKRGYEFKARSREMALLYLEELKLRDVMYRMKPTGVLRDKLEKRLALVAELRPDPYTPAQKHVESWYLKRSRTISCLAELYYD